MDNVSFAVRATQGDGHQREKERNFLSMHKPSPLKASPFSKTESCTDFNVIEQCGAGYLDLGLCFTVYIQHEILHNFFSEIIRAKFTPLTRRN